MTIMHKAPAGPKTFEEAIRWAPANCKAMFEYDEINGTSFLKELKETVSDGVEINSNYSGEGCVETTCPMIADAVKGLIAADGDIYNDQDPGSKKNVQEKRDHQARSITIYSCADIEPHCRQSLMNHKKESRAEHTFGNLLDRLEHGARLKVEKMVKQVAQKLDKRLKDTMLQ